AAAWGCGLRTPADGPPGVSGTAGLRKAGKPRTLGCAAFIGATGPFPSARRARAEAVGRVLRRECAQLAQRGLDAGAVGRVGLAAVLHVAALDEVRRIAHRAGGVVEQQLLLVRG